MAETKNEVKTKSKKTGFFKGVRQEWNKIIWTSRHDLYKQTVAVVTISVILGIIISAVDGMSVRLIEQILKI